MAKSSLSETIRERAVRDYIGPARKRGDRTVTILVGDVHRTLRLINRVPAVCSALSSKGFLDENNLVLEKREGPPSGLSTTVKLTYRLLQKPQPASQQTPSPQFLSLRGSAKQVFRELGGGEAFLRGEREQFHGRGANPVE
jgi:hypothetical protein